MSRRGFATIELYIPILVIALLAAILVPNFLKARAQGQLTACRSNLKNLGTALEMYATDSKGEYPKLLKDVSPRYLKGIPTCPSTKNDTYSNSYVCSASNFSLCCKGENHRVDRPDYPSYNAREGLVDDSRGTLKSGNDRVLDLLGIGMIGYFCFIKLFFRPQPMPVVEEWEKLNSQIETAGCLGWVLLNLLLAGLSVHRLGFALGMPLGVISADLLTRAGWLVWRALSPPHQAKAIQESPFVSSIPGLTQPLRFPIQPDEREKSMRRLVSFSFPTLFLTLTLSLQLDSDPVRSRLMALALTALLGIPLYLWGGWLAKRLLARQLELLPGSGQLLLHHQRWGKATITCLGSLAEATHLGEGQVRIGDQIYRIANEDFLSYLPR